MGLRYQQAGEPPHSLHHLSAHSWSRPQRAASLHLRATLNRATAQHLSLVTVLAHPKQTSMLHRFLLRPPLQELHRWALLPPPHQLRTWAKLPLGSLTSLIASMGTVRTWQRSATHSQTQTSRRPHTGRRQHSPPPLHSPPPARLAEGRTTTYRASTRIDADRDFWAGKGGRCKVQNKNKNKKKSGKCVLAKKAKLEFWIVLWECWMHTVCETETFVKAGIPVKLKGV